MVSDKLRELKEAKGLTNHEIAEATNIPDSTINRILAGQTENPTFSNVADIVVALGGSLDDVIDNHPPLPHSEEPEPVHESPTPDTTIMAQLTTISERLHILEIACENMHQVAKTKDRWISRMFIYCCILTSIVITIAIINP